MISPWMARLIGFLPERVTVYISRKMLNSYVNKYANIEVKGIEHLDEIDRPIIFICNHLSNSDALVLGHVLEKEDLTFVAGMKLNDDCLTKLGMSITKTIVIKPNSADKGAISSIIKTIKKGKNILIFPEGTRSRTSSMNEGKKGVVLIQRLSRARVVPVGIWGTEKLLPINDKGMALESFHYADVGVNIGAQLDIPKKNKDEEKHEYETRIINFFMHEIAELLPEKYRGIYKF
ncbi:lysophospholipid acyltransferase family protein [Clostridium luticellarii]|jgi:1-acyl-sn-glycerol-3-phosphate acyltransferase|uniref:lysophospholipid acyltransferase family protein n=1 Tax=Clostridium luticellarii TaxID=1691940 RepID=UPI002354FD18|nr:lysophospholipid acyltransferase family protein [Clostridium luticellarii]MCI1946506.1 1-acyl-sn-glycerol-3-phosphate acyltransferase [Clostridium luticellarii]MCI1969707.1 1-acyl-sn-glycerol-3-phosphate acyltransferase [Clostridium luticellarii]